MTAALPIHEDELKSMREMRVKMTDTGVKPFKVAVVISPGFIPMDMVGIQTVLGTCPGAELHLVWKKRELVEGFPNWWTMPTTTFEECPDDLDVLAAPMMPPEVISDPDVVDFFHNRGVKARYIIGVCCGVLLAGAAGLVRGKRVTASYNALSVLSELGPSEVLPPGSGVVVDGNLYTAGPGIGSFEASLLVAADAFGQQMAAFAELAMEYDPHPPFGTGNASKAHRDSLAMLEALESHMVPLYRSGTTAALARVAKFDLPSAVKESQLYGETSNAI
ncbi:DJ-1/PfpI family protein [Microvirga guangxiensis]|uniref:Transcriptional regulator GlxA family, contains an amidase domain and an AraC-type DNA-binding HTH domain n=1 Tax=Microvirga guangxiensis TaxID=549386 RepID=A0A1G5KK33_9HYPH|nr:DJ-1/PfpI family protein [Microvirga guangxiensis]SCZ01003.1 Transcriptional regulator GlxA family, contains an amidase domain and an AraC-type DNA-binding HTH domain [Microvirga guangxiensis]